MKTIKHLLTTVLLACATFPSASAQEVVTIDRSLGTNVEFDETEGMTILYDSLLNDWKVKTYLYVDSTCQSRDVDPTFPDSVYIDRLQRIPAVMELPYNHIVRQYIDRYTKRLRKSVAVMLGAGNFYFPIFEAELERYGLPLELKYLPIIESALKPKAVSPAGAGGLWQFMVGTGKQYGLKVNSVIDERCDPIKSSEAAARYLRDLYKIYHDWALVLAAYNCGPGNVNKAIHRAGARDYWQIYPFLPKETRGYVPAFIAATYAMTYYCEHGIAPMRSRFPITTDTIVINRDISLRQISEVVGINLELLRSLNPQYRTDRIPGKSQPCTLRMPDEMIHAFLDYGDDVYRYRASELLARRSEVSVRGERSSRTTAQSVQPSAPAQSTMPGSTQPSIAATEAIVPTETRVLHADTTIVAPVEPQRAIGGEVIDVPLTDTLAVQPEPDTQTTIILTDDDEVELQPVPTNTIRQTTAPAQPQQPKAQTQPQTQSQGRGQSRGQGQSQGQGQTRQRQQQAQPQPKPQTQTQSQGRGQSRGQGQSQGQGQTRQRQQQAQPQPKPQTQTQSQGRGQSRGQGQSQGQGQTRQRQQQAQPQPKPKPHTQTQSQGRGQSRGQGQSQGQGQTRQRLQQAQTQPKPKPQTH
ncbi:MAG: lytic transglycosylase domain-containing protein, partial [Bacteroidaceae bacterium]|nr:lytic transglycosylase domain-containing protein [Bacteroidaceae bacterium]